MVFLKLFILIVSAGGAAMAAFELNNYSKYKNIYNEGVDKLKAGNYKAAERAFLKVYEIEPEMDINTYNLGLTYFYLNKLDLALDFFKKTLELNSQEADSYYNIGIIHYLRNKKDETIKYFNKALDLSHKKDEQILFSMTLVYTELQDYDMAIQSASKLIELCPSNIDYRLLLADIYEQLISDTGNLQSVDFAIKTYQEIIDIDPTHEMANVKIANCYAQKGDIENCQEFCQQAIAANAKSGDALYLLGIINFATQDYEKAVFYFEQVFSAKPTLKQAYLNAAYAYAKVNNKVKALEIFAAYKGRVQPHEITPDMDAFFSELGESAA